MDTAAARTMALLALCLLVAAGCSSTPSGEKNTSPDDQEDMAAQNVQTGPDMGPMQNNDRPKPTGQAGQLIWKRRGALARDLARALELPVEDLCKELGQSDCLQVHLVSLGANEPEQLGLYEPVAEPLSTTPAVVDRLALGACRRAVERDEQAAGEPKVFTELDLSIAQLSTEDAAQAEVLGAQVQVLYRRFLARDPKQEEIALHLELASDEGGQARSAREFGLLSCYAVASSTEFLFY